MSCCVAPGDRTQNLEMSERGVRRRGRRARTETDTQRTVLLGAPGKTARKGLAGEGGEGTCTWRQLCRLCFVHRLSGREPGPVQFDTHRWGVGGDISHKLNSVEFRGIRGLGPEVGT